MTTAGFGVKLGQMRNWGLSPVSQLLRALPQADIAAIGFHAQQAAEKALKAVCMLHAVEIRRTHDLAALAMQLQRVGVELPLSVEELRALNPFAVEFRYDDAFFSPLTRDALAGLLDRLFGWVESAVTGGAVS